MAGLGYVPRRKREPKDTAADIFRKSLAEAAGQMLVQLPASVIGGAIETSFKPGGGLWEAVSPSSEVDAYRRQQQNQIEQGLADIAGARARTDLAGAQTEEARFATERGRAMLPLEKAGKQAETGLAEAQGAYYREMPSLRREEMWGTEAGRRDELALRQQQLAWERERYAQAQKSLRRAAVTSRGPANDFAVKDWDRVAANLLALKSGGTLVLDDGRTVEVTDLSPEDKAAWRDMMQGRRDAFRAYHISRGADPALIQMLEGGKAPLSLPRTLLGRPKQLSPGEEAAQSGRETAQAETERHNIAVEDLAQQRAMQETGGPPWDVRALRTAYEEAKKQQGYFRLSAPTPDAPTPFDPEVNYYGDLLTQLGHGEIVYSPEKANPQRK